MIQIIFLTSLFSFLWATPHPTIYLGIGETYRVKTKALETIRVQKKGIVQIKDEGSQVILIGKKLGTTDISIGIKKLSLHVMHKKNRDSLTQLKKWMLEKRGPEIVVVDGEAVIEGRLLRIRDFTDLQEVTDSNSKFSLRLKAEKSLQQEVLELLQRVMIENNLTPGKLSFFPHWEYRVPLHEKSNLPQYKKILTPFGIKTRVDGQGLSDRPIIKIQVYIAHVKKSFMRDFGIRWPGEIKANILPGSLSNWEVFNLSLKALEDQGQGKMLATPTLLTESESTAEFHSGGEFPIRSTTQFNNNVEWKRYGLFLKTTPQANSRKNLKIKIDIELSSLDQTSSSTDIPALSRSQVKTQINMESPRPIVISGFLQQQSGNSRAGLPWLQQIPILNPLFSNGQIYNNDYELLFVLVPSFYNE